MDNQGRVTQAEYHAALDRRDQRIGTLTEENVRLRRPFRNADNLDWEQLFRMLPDSGYGKFWKAVMTEVREALMSETR